MNNVPGATLEPSTQQTIIDNWSCFERQDDGLTTTYNHQIVPLYITFFEKGSCSICVQNNKGGGGGEKGFFCLDKVLLSQATIEVACICNFKYQHVTLDLVLCLPLGYCMLLIWVMIDNVAQLYWLSLDFPPNSNSHPFKFWQYQWPEELTATLNSPIISVGEKLVWATLIFNLRWHNLGLTPPSFSLMFHQDFRSTHWILLIGLKLQNKRIAHIKVLEKQLVGRISTLTMIWAWMKIIRQMDGYGCDWELATILYTIAWLASYEEWVPSSMWPSNTRLPFHWDSSHPSLSHSLRPSQMHL